MINKVAEHAVQMQRAPSADELKRIFEKAVCEIHHSEKAARNKPEYRSPIVQRRNFSGVSGAGAEKRAMSDAAKALAQLWKVSAAPR